MAGLDANTKLLLHGNAINASLEVLDSSDQYSDQTLERHVVTQAGNATLSTAQKKFGSSSLLLDGTGDYVSIPISGDWKFLTNDFTMECHAYFVASAGDNRVLIDLGYTSNGARMTWLTTNNIQINVGAAGTYSFAFTPTLNTWYHIAASRNGTNLRVFIDGTQIGSTATSSDSITPTAETRIGASVSSTFYFNGYIDEVRVSKSARYTANFTAPTSAYTTDANTVLLLHMDTQDVSGDGGSAAYHIPDYIGTAQIANTPRRRFGQGSFSVDGDSDYLTITNHADWTFDGDFVVEGWFHPTVDANSYLMGKYSASAGVWGIQWAADNNIYWYYGNGLAYSFGTADMTQYLNTWNHIAIARSSGTTRCYLNGVKLGSDQADANTYTSGNALYIGTLGPILSTYFGGYIDEVRISKGTDRGYTGSTITLATAPFTSDADTKLLLHFDDMLDSGNTNHSANITYVATAQHTGIARFGNGGMYSDGASYVQFPDHSDWDFGTGQFTADCWIKWYGSPNNGYWLDLGTAGSGNNGFLWGWVGGNFYLYLMGAGDPHTWAYSPKPNLWYHIAISRDSSNDVRLFVNGVSQGTWNRTSNIAVSAAIQVNGSSGATDFYGVLDEVRISNTCRWSAGFTPPTAEYTSDSNTKLLLHNDIDYRDSGVTGHTPTPTGTVSITSVKRFGSGSIVLDGDSDYVEFPDSADWTFGGGDGNFTIDFWMKPTQDLNSFDKVLFDHGPDANNRTILAIHSGQLRFYAYVNPTIYVDIGAAAYAWDADVWYHIAVVRGWGGNANDYAITINGVVYATGTDSSTLPNHAGTFKIGYGWDYGAGTARYFAGYIDEPRVSSNARWIAAFTPPIEEYDLDAGPAGIASIMGVLAANIASINSVTYANVASVNSVS